MERTAIEGMDNANLMAFVQKARGLFGESSSSDVQQTSAWSLFHNLRYAEEVMKFRNLPLDDERLGKKFGKEEFGNLVLAPTEKDDQENDDQKIVTGKT